MRNGLDKSLQLHTHHNLLLIYLSCIQLLYRAVYLYVCVTVTIYVYLYGRKTPTQKKKYLCIIYREAGYTSGEVRPIYADPTIISLSVCVGVGGGGG